MRRKKFKLADFSGWVDIRTFTCWTFLENVFISQNWNEKLTVAWRIKGRWKKVTRIKPSRKDLIKRNNKENSRIAGTFVCYYNKTNYRVSGYFAKEVWLFSDPRSLLGVLLHYRHCEYNLKQPPPPNLSWWRFGEVGGGTLPPHLKDDPCEGSPDWEY